MLDPLRSSDQREIGGGIDDLRSRLGGDIAAQINVQPSRGGSPFRHQISRRSPRGVHIKKRDCPARGGGNQQSGQKFCRRLAVLQGEPAILRFAHYRCPLIIVEPANSRISGKLLECPFKCDINQAVWRDNVVRKSGLLSADEFT
jgi:hypothetical protein